MENYNFVCLYRKNEKDVCNVLTQSENSEATQKVFSLYTVNAIEKDGKMEEYRFFFHRN